MVPINAKQRSAMLVPVSREETILDLRLLEETFHVFDLFPHSDSIRP